MRRTYWLLMALLLLLAGVSLQFMPGKPLPPGNLLQNPGFEAGNSPQGWTPEKRAANKGSIEIASSPVHGGLHSLKLVPNGNNYPPGMTANPLGAGQAFPAGPFRGKRVYIAGWLSAEGQATAVAGLYTLGLRGGVQPTELRQSSAGSQLNYLRDEMDVPNDRRILYLIVNLHVEGTSGSATFDDLYVGLTPPEEREAPVTGASMRANITVSAGRDVRRIPPTIYGVNLEWIRNGNGIFDPGSDALNEQLVALTKDLGAALLRFPGGIFSDFYHWKNGIGPRRARVSSPHMPGSNDVSPNSFGTDEALEFSRRTGAPLMITVNIATGSPAEAVEWLQYVRAQTGPGKAPPVIYWEIGNEPYVRGDAAYVKAGGMKPEEYVRRFFAFERALRAADPSIRIGAVTEENYGHIAPRAYPDWTRQILDNAGERADFLSVHNAYAPVVADPAGKTVREVYTAMWAAPKQIASNLRDFSDRLGAHDPTGHTKIAVSEWGPLFHFVPSSPYVDHVKTLGSALYTASALKSFIEAPRVELANFFKLVDPLFMGLIGMRNGQFVPTASYYALQLYTRHFGEVLVESATEVPEFRNRQVGLVDSASNNPFLEVVASRAENRKKFFIIAINRSFDQDIPAKIHLQDIRPTGGTAWVLSGTGVDANTGTQLPKGANWAKQANDSRFEQGGPGEISFKSLRLVDVAQDFEYTFPRLSAVSLEIETK